MIVDENPTNRNMTENDIKIIHPKAPIKITYRYFNLFKYLL